MVFTKTFKELRQKIKNLIEATAIGGRELEWQSFFSSQRYWGAVPQQKGGKYDSKCN